MSVSIKRVGTAAHTASDSMRVSLWSIGKSCCLRHFLGLCDGDVRESLAHGEANAPFLQRNDALRVSTGKAPTAPKFLDGTPVPPPIFSICSSLMCGEQQGVRAM